MSHEYEFDPEEPEPFVVESGSGTAIADVVNSTGVELFQMIESDYAGSSIPKSSAKICERIQRLGSDWIPGSRMEIDIVVACLQDRELGEFLIGEEKRSELVTLLGNARDKIKRMDAPTSPAVLLGHAIAQLTEQSEQF